jgi:hypothetical protein
VYDTVFVEGNNTPAVMLAYEFFGNDARSAAVNKGMPGVRVVLEPIVSECTDMEEIEDGVTGVMGEVIAALTRPLTAEEESPKPREAEKPSRIIFKGNLEEVNRFFYQRGWADGLPIIPPTEEAIAEMLTGTDLPPDHLVVKLEPRLGKATVEKIAINAVMAGALPTYMPLLIAGTKALVSNRGAVMMACSTGSFAPVWVVNGPIRNDLHLNYSYGALSPGDMANSAIGRAMRLITKNIRGVRKGMEDMGVFGNPGKYALVIPENEEANPWEPMHVEHGFKKEDSTLTLTFSQSFQQMSSYATDDKGLLASVTNNISPQRMGPLWLLLTPTNARSLGKRGWTKKSIADFIMENTLVPRGNLSRYYSGIDKGDPKELVPVFASGPGGPRPPGQPAPIQIFVIGGSGSWIGMLSGGQSVTEKIELPANWDKLVAKYNNVVPTYARY